jgi:hypothetical protein
VRVARGNRHQPAEPAHGIEGRVVDEPRRVPEQVSAVGLDDQAALPDRDRRRGTDAEQASLDLAEVAAMTLPG